MTPKEELEQPLTDEGHRSRLHRYLSRRLGNAADAQDAIQESYLRYLLIPHPKDVREPGSYLFRIAANLASEWNWRAKRARVIFDSELAEESATTWRRPDDLVAQLTSEEHLQRVLGKIPQPQRRILLMNKRDGLSYHEIAKQTGYAPDTVLKYLCQSIAHARRAQWD